jgi:hypothetical protein
MVSGGGGGLLGMQEARQERQTVEIMMVWGGGQCATSQSCNWHSLFGLVACERCKPCTTCVACVD